MVAYSRNIYQEDSTKEVSNEDVIQINALAMKYLEHPDTSEHPISLLASLECQLTPFENEMELNANIATIDSVDEQMECEKILVGKEDNLSIADEMSTIHHEAHIDTVTEEFNRFDPFKYEIFQFNINFESDLQSDEQSTSDTDNQSEKSTYMDTMTDFEDIPNAENMNLLSNTEEMYILFCGEDNKRKLNKQPRWNLSR